ncbi:alpha-kinase [Fragilaria crotonensis]|nr:alpha-kinase [Fragilaria crotonensis]
MTEQRGYAFDDEDAALSTIDEYDEGDDSLENDEEISEDHVEAAKSKTGALAAAADIRMREMMSLLERMKTGTATRAEKKRLELLNGKLSELRNEVEISKHRESELEIKRLKSVTRTKTTDLRKALREKEIHSIIHSVCAAETVDLAFLVDCTGSMASHIGAVKANISAIASQITRTNKNLRLRLAMVGYRDFSDGDKQFEVLDFVHSIDEFKGFVARIVASGGADTPEDMAGAVQKANGLSWAHPTRVVFLIADAPCHGSEFHSFADSYPAGSPGVDIKAELRTLISNHGNGSMTVYFGRITDFTDSMLCRFEELGIHLDVVSMTDVSKLTACVTKSVRKSIFKTVTATGGGTRSHAFTSIGDVASLLNGRVKRRSVSLKDYCILPTPPSALKWKEQVPVPVKVFRYKRIKSIDDLQAPIGLGILPFVMQMRRAAEPFSEGGHRIAYHGQLSRNVKGLDHVSNAMVLKSFKHVGKRFNVRQRYLQQMEVSAVANFLAGMYNESSHRPEHCARIRMLEVCVVEEEDNSNEESGSRRYCAEAHLPTDGSPFMKYSNNTGFWDYDHVDESLLRFTDFTFMVTRKFLMVTDLQGVRRGKEFFLTDPAILCKDILRFGHTNLGAKFMKRCKDSTRALMSENGWY